MQNSKEQGSIKFDFRTFSIMVLLAVVPMVIGGWYLFASYEEAYLEMAGASLGDFAETAFSLLNSYLQGQIIQIAGLAEVPELRAAVAAGNRDLQRDLEGVRKAIPKMADSWTALRPEAPFAKAILDNAAARFLRRYTTINPTYREIQVTDFFGRVVAATEKSDKFYYAHDNWWKETYGDGRRGLVYIGDAYWSESARSYLMDLSQPLVDPGSGVIGVIRVVLDLQGLYALIGSIQPGPSHSVALIHARGDVISAPGFSSLQRATYPATVDILNAREKGRRHFLTSQEPLAMYGLPLRSFQQLYPNLNWIVVATGKVADIKGPLPQLRIYFVALVVGLILLVLLATLMLSRVEAKPVLEQDPHLERL